MAIDAPNGFTPFGHLIGSVTAELSQVKYGFASAYATSIFRGDLVSLVAAGTIVRSSESDDNILGAFAGVKYVDAGGSQVFSNMWTGATVGSEITALIYDDPWIIYRVQADGAIGQDSVGENANMINTVGNTRTGNSREEVDATTSTVIDQIRVIGRVDEPGNEWGDNTDLLVLINEHAYRTHDLVGI